MERAAKAALDFAPGLSNPRGVAMAAISAWIISRSMQCAAPRIDAELLFNISDARIRGFVEAALPNIASTLMAQGFDFNLPFGALAKEQVIDFIAAGIVGAQEAAVAANESLGFPFDDEVPFG